MPLNMPEDVILYDHIEYGSKILDLKWNENERLFFTYIEADSSREKMPGETTHVYEEVMNKCQGRADLDGKPVTYVLNTRREVMKQWALSKGQELFKGWDKTETKGQLLMCTKVFYPTGSSRRD